MRLLLDTQVYLWYLADSPRLPESARIQIASAQEVYISSASIWEACIKISIGKLTAQANDLVTGIEGSGFVELPVLARHAARVTNLPPYHNDPFDRLLVAQAMDGPFTLVSTDTILTEYTELVAIVDH